MKKGVENVFCFFFSRSVCLIFSIHNFVLIYETWAISVFYVLQKSVSVYGDESSRKWKVKNW